MEILPIVFVVLGLCGCPHLSHQQRVAPGVPPQHYDPNLQHQQQQYQQPPPPQQYQQQQQQQHIPQQQQQFQQQQVPIQHQQIPVVQQPPQHNQVPHGHGGVPVQQQQVPIQHQQVPQQGGGHGHGHGHGHHGVGQGQPLLDTAQIVQDRQHIQEHMEVPIDTSQMSEQELQFHYFKMHDADNNNKLDGCELVKSLIHWHDQSNHDQRSDQPIPEAKIFKDDELVQMIDPILLNDDKNKDGFIDYAEFVQAQASAAAKATPTQTA